MKSKAYEKYELHSRRKLLQALADLIPDTEGFILIADSDKIISFDISSVWDYGSSDSIIELANIKNEVTKLYEDRSRLESEVRSKSQKVARYNKQLGIVPASDVRANTNLDES